MVENKVFVCPLFEDPEGNAYKFYVDHDMDYWVYDNENVKLDIEAINVPRLLTNVSEQTWQGIPKGTKIGIYHLKRYVCQRLNLII